MDGEEEEGEEGTCRTDYPHFSCAQACVRAARHGKIHGPPPRRDPETHPAVLKCHGANSKGQVCLEPVAPYQSAVVFAVLVGQVGNGGRDAGAEEQLPLVQVALVDFVEELVVSAHISRGSSRFSGARGLSRKINNTESGAAAVPPQPSPPDGSSDLLWNLLCPLLYLLNQRLEATEMVSVGFRVLCEHYYSGLKKRNKILTRTLGAEALNLT